MAGLTLEKAQEFVGKEAFAFWCKMTSKVVEVRLTDFDMILARLENGALLNIETLAFRDKNTWRPIEKFLETTQDKKDD